MPHLSTLLGLLLLPSTLACSGDDPAPIAARQDAAQPEPVEVGAAGPPDVYLIVIDSLRADHLGLYGYDQPTSPELDRWAEGAVVFDQAHTTAPWTLPTFATVLTGHHPYAVGIREKASSVDPAVTTLGELFRDQGWATGAVISHIYLRQKYGLMQGMGFLDAQMIKGHEGIVGKGVTNRALYHLQEHTKNNPDQPLFMLVHYFDPHYDYLLHPSLLDTYPDYDGPMNSGMPVSDMKKRLRQAKGEELEKDRRRLKSLYDSEIRYNDLHLARLLEGIEESGRGDNALIVILGDHGEELGERDSRWIGHTKVVSQEVLRVPLIMRLPGGAQPVKRVETPVSVVDLLPTIAHYAGLEIPEDANLHGRVLDLSRPQDWRQTVFAETGRWRTLQAARKGRWKLVVDPVNAPEQPSLYDLVADPGELKDVSQGHPEVVADLQKELAIWRTAIELERGQLLPTEQEPELTEEEIEQLRAMGYIE